MAAWVFGMRDRWLAALFAAFVFATIPCQAQKNRNQEVRELVRAAMDAYSNLELEVARDTLEQALSMSAGVDKKLLARAYVSYGVLWVGGFADNERGQENFVKGICRDRTISVDPLFSTPEIDEIFSMARNQASAAKCRAQGGDESEPEGEITEVPTPRERPSSRPKPRAVAECGDLEALGAQKQKYEIPFFITLNSQSRSTVAKMTVFYAFDSSNDYKPLPLRKMSGGYGALLTCDEGQIRVFDPNTVAFYIEGTDRSGEVVCRNGSEEMALEVVMQQDVDPLPFIAGMEPKECAPCAPWDKTCGKKPGFGDECMPDSGCADGLVCGDSGVCEEGEGGKEEKPTGDRIGPRKFYVNATVGTGFGIAKQIVNVRQIDTTKVKSETGYGAEVIQTNQPITGAAWNGVPLRLGFGLFLTERFSLELTGRLDLAVVTEKKAKTCLEAGNGAYNANLECSIPKAKFDEVGPAADAKAELASKGVALTGDPKSGGTYVMTKTPLVAWLANVRARYRLVSKGGLAMSIFGGLGFGHIKYRVGNPAGDPYFPIVGKFDIELGAGLVYYFGKHFGLTLDVPIDILVGDGFGLNFELAFGLSIGF